MTQGSVSADDSPPRFIAEASEPVREHLAGSVPLSEFLRGAGMLTLEERRLLVDQALILFEQNYVHLPLKIAMHAVNPVQRLRVLRRRLERQTPETMGEEWMFHAELTEIFHSVRDLHTNYILPAPFAGKIAYLPFQIEEYVEVEGEGEGRGRRSRYLVTHVLKNFTAPGFRRGAEITHWSGIPIEAAVGLNAARYAGSNNPARHSRGVQSLTVRPLSVHLQPFEEWVTVSYTDPDGDPHELRENWRVVDNLPAFDGDDGAAAAGAPGLEARAAADEAAAEGRAAAGKQAAVGDRGAAALSLGLDLESDETNRAKLFLFAPHVMAQEESARARQPLPHLRSGEVESTMPRVFTARAMPTSSGGTVGHIRIFTFMVANPDAFVKEFVRLIGLLPQDGLIVDLRDNGGGNVIAAEQLLQTLTPRRITPEPVQFINTPLNLRICRMNQSSEGINLGPWVPSMEQAVEIGTPFSSAFPITPESSANALGQQYFGPVVLITNARCYSATDIFAAGFQDHGIGPVLGTDDNTGAGGANVWTHETLLMLMNGEPPYAPLPKDAGMRVSMRRTLRVGALAGTPVEDLGVIPDERHHMTRRDLLEDNVDLLDRAAALLRTRTAYRLDIAEVSQADGALRIQLRTDHLDRVDLYLDQRPRASADVVDGHVDLTVPGPGALGARSARVCGFAAGELVACRTERLG
ncbi:S41 family peptidase [Streptomyces sp. LX-29]|uniref:S41 family peptidase n=1 Tax=Streptomyces sp. LX-29 TaxID=2900152 RepID=UPI00240D9E96|nr:S41 family peptidase [Streptomyces sp. LX-29]WFB06150.1 S41 family peptidase [Streptomyces sp. LX-29]